MSVKAHNLKVNPMSQLLEQAVAEARRLPQENQDAVAAIILEEIEEDRRWEMAFDGIAEKLAARTARIQALKKSLLRTTASLETRMSWVASHVSGDCGSRSG